MENNNPLMCNPENGVCQIPTDKGNLAKNNFIKVKKKPVKIIYYTDPICSSCWGIEPQLRKLQLEYGNIIEMEYRMGGLLPNWSYNGGGISSPSDVAHHWDEASIYYDMPIDGDIWLEDPLDSSYPPSIAFKAAQIQNNEKSILFLREMREMLFLQKKNIAKWENLELAAKKIGLDIVKFRTDFAREAEERFEEDLKFGRELAVRGFPTMFFINAAGNREIVYGSKPYEVFEKTLLKLFPDAIKTNYDKTWCAVFAKYHSLTAREFSELIGISVAESKKQLDDLLTNGNVEKLTTKNGSIWKIKNTNS